MMSIVAEFSFVLDNDYCSDDLVAFAVTTPSGDRVRLWAQVELAHRVVVLRQFAIFGIEATTVALGLSTLRAMARAAMEEFDVDCIRIDEARRISGAGPGRVASPVVFKR